MLTDTDGIVLRQTKTSYNRTMVHLFTRRFGRISAGTSIGEKSKSKGAAALKPFTHGRYELFQGRETYNINYAEVLKSYYGLGEDVDKYMHAAYVLEFTAKALPEEMPAPALLDLLLEFLGILEQREKGLGTLVLAYQAKLLDMSGCGPSLDRCVICGEEKPAFGFSIPEGGIVCEECAAGVEKTGDSALIRCDKSGIVDVLKFLIDNPLQKLDNIALNEEMGTRLQKILREYAAHHLDISDIKSEKLV